MLRDSGQQLYAQLSLYQAGESLAMAQEYMKGEKMKKANVHYLEHEPFTFTTGAGRKWVIYGSPVSCITIILT